MKIVFMGTSDFAVPTLAKIIASDHELPLVITQPDRPKGRGNKMVPSPVKELALQNGLNIYQPLRIKNEEAVAAICSLDLDLIVVVSYGQIIPEVILNHPRLGCINVHASLLPRYRGAAPIQRAIMDGETCSGVTTMYMDQGLDTGDIILQKEVPIDPEMDHGSYAEILAETGANLLMETLALMPKGALPRHKQDSNLATYAHMLGRENEKIDWSNQAEMIHNQIRALSPRPAAFTSFQGKNIKIFTSRVTDQNRPAGEAGQIMEIQAGALQVQTGYGWLELREVQLEGKKRMSCIDFLKGFKLNTGDKLGS